MFFIEIIVDNKRLDKYQKKVLKTKAKNLLVLAGAGSGKTFTIVAKIKKILLEGIKSQEILCITFTKKAAQSLEEKLKKEQIIIKVKTFHSLGYEILNKYQKINIAEEKMMKNIINKHLKKEKQLNHLTNTNFKTYGNKKISMQKIQNNIIINSSYKENIENIIITFINLFKGNNYKIEDFKKFNKINNKNNIYFQKERHKTFLNLIKKIIIEYEKQLKKQKLSDYNDLINKSIEIIKIKGIKKYKYIIIDEYQDTSNNKTELIKEIINQTNAKLIAVGDDWQSIYGFTGSNLEIFINFKRIFKKGKIIKLKYTYRNSKELLKITSKFICKNPNQINKKLKSKKTNPNPIHIIYYKESIEEIWEKVLTKTENTKTLILSRNNKDIKQIPYINKNMKFLTMHKSKGLETENTIIINLEDNYNSMPSKIKESEYLKYVSNKIDQFKYSEERRLFYVALTRCKKNNYLLVKKDKPSIFVDELITNYSKYIAID